MEMSIPAIIQIVETILAIALVLPCIVFSVEVFVAFFRRNGDICKKSKPFTTEKRRAILMPAHNEAAVIQATLSTLTSQIQPTDRLLVVADNCTDDTATIARKAGATVIERHDEQNRGKGYALDFGLRYLSKDAPDVVIMVDADCQVQPGSIDAVANLALKSHRPVQATYLLNQGANPSPKEMLSTFAFKVKNLVRPLGMRGLGQSCLLTGTGMAFPWFVIEKVNLASGNIVEDMQLGLDLAVAGHLPLMCPNAMVLGEQPKQSSVAITQRTRWEHGHLQTLFTSVPFLLREGIKQRRLGLVALALDISVPPISLLVSLWAAVAILMTIATLLLGGAWLPLVMIYGAGLGIVSAIVLAWYGFARNELPANKLAYIPGYILWKMPMYYRFMSKPENTWVRTEREL